MDNITGDRYYFAYGSNMLPKQMQMERCPGSEPVGVGVLKGWKFVMNDRGVASIEESANSTVIGVVWNINAEHEATLDRHEGVAEDWYYKDYVNIVLENGETVYCLVYIDPNVNPGPPRGGYLEKIIGGAVHFRLPDEYIDGLRKWSGI